MNRRGFLGSLVALSAVPLAWLFGVQRVPIGDPRCSCRLCVIERQYRAAVISSNGPRGDGIEWYADTK
jgi:hypothetical protein